MMDFANQWRYHRLERLCRGGTGFGRGRTEGGQLLFELFYIPITRLLGHLILCITFERL